MAADSPDASNDIEQVVDRMVDWPRDETISIGDVLDRVGRRTYGPMLLVLGLFGGGPTGAIPGATMGVAVIVVVLAAQLAIGLSRPWLPRRILAIEVSTNIPRRYANDARSMARRLGSIVTGRLDRLTGRIAARIAGALCVGLALLTFPLALVPFAAAVPMSALVVLGIALTAEDGIWMVLGMIWSGAALAGSIAILASGF